MVAGLTACDNFHTLPEEELIYVRFGIGLGHAILGNKNYDSMNQELLDTLKDNMGDEALRKAVLEVAEKLNITAPLALRTIKGKRLTFAMMDFVDGMCMAHEGSPITVNICACNALDCPCENLKCKLTDTD